MSNDDPLTQAEFAAYRPPPIMIDHIERCRSGFNVAKRDFRIVDWGCGRGKLVLWLRERGYEAVGVDIDPKPFANGADLFRSKGYVLEECLHAWDSTNTTPFADSSFHFVTSWQTLEHVRDLQRVAAEWSRLTMDKGGGFHIYPPHRRIVEGHLFMPFVHWLPKNAARRWLIGAFVLVGVEPNWWPNKRVGWREKVRTYYGYSVNETFYRAPEVVRGDLALHGFDTEVVDVQPHGLGKKLAQQCMGARLSSSLIRSWYMSYGNDLGLATTLHKRPEAAGADGG
jgi:SAM-dependent methyltransferase